MNVPRHYKKMPKREYIALRAEYNKAMNEIPNLFMEEKLKEAGK